MYELRRKAVAVLSSLGGRGRRTSVASIRGSPSELWRPGQAPSLPVLFPDPGSLSGEATVFPHVTCCHLLRRDPLGDAASSQRSVCPPHSSKKTPLKPLVFPDAGPAGRGVAGRAEAAPSEIGSLFCEAYLRPVWQLQTEARSGGEAGDGISSCSVCVFLGMGGAEEGGNGIELQQTEFRLDTWENFPAQYHKAEGRQCSCLLS